MGTENEGLKPSPKFEAITDDDDNDVASETPFQKDSYTAPPVVQVAQAEGGDKNAPAVAAGDAPAAAPPAADVPAAAPVEKKVVNDKVEVAAAKPAEDIDPYEHINNAQMLRAELETLEAQGRKPEEYIAVRINGEVKEVKVADRVAQLKQGMVDELALAKKGAEAIPLVGDGTKRGIDGMAKANTVERDKLAKELGIDVSKLNIEMLGQEYQKADGNKERQDKIVKLGEVLATRAALARLHFAPMGVKLLEAEFRGRGYLDPGMKPGETVSDEQLKKAFEVLNGVPKPGGPADIAAFGEGKEIEDAVEVYATSARTLDILKLEQQQQRGLSIIAELNLATKEGEDPETHFKNAIKIADTLNVGYLKNAAHKPENAKDNVAQEIVDTIRMGSNARLKYVEHLVSKGRFNEAQVHLAQVKADSPELIFAMENDQPVYRKYDNGKGGKRSYEEIDRAVALGVKVRPATFEQAHSLLFDKLSKDKLGSEKDLTAFTERLTEKGELPTDAEKLEYLRSKDAKSTECLKVMTLTRDQMVNEVEEANKVLDKEIEAQETKKKQYDEKTKLTQDEEVEKLRIERVIASLKNTKAEREAYINRIDALTDFTQGVVHLSLGGAKSAHTAFSDAIRKDPSLDAEFEKMKLANPEMKTLSELSKLTSNTFEAYVDRNKGKFAAAGAMLAGTFTGVGLIGVCGYVGAGVTTTAVVATTGGALAGGATSWGIHRAVSGQAGWPEFRDGAKVGGLSAALIASPWAAQAYTKVAVDAAAKTGVAANVSQIGNLASKIGISRGTLLGGMGMSYTFAAGDMYFGKKPAGQAVVDATREGVMNTLMMSMTQRWGMSTDQGANFAKAAMFNRTTFTAGFGLAAVPQGFAMALDGKSFKEAVAETLRDGTQNTFMFAFLSRLKVTEAGKASGTGSTLGLNNKLWMAGGIAGLSGAGPINNYFHGRQTFSEAAQDWATNAAVDTAALMFLKKYGINDYGRSSAVTNPPKPGSRLPVTMGDTMSYAKRAFLMQESWNVTMSVGQKQIMHDLKGDPYYISQNGQGIIAPFVADFFDYNFGKGYNMLHPGDRKSSNRKLDEELNLPLTAGKFADKKNVDPLQKGEKTGLFFDYSKKPPKPADK